MKMLQILCFSIKNVTTTTTHTQGQPKNSTSMQFQQQSAILDEVGSTPPVILSHFQTTEQSSGWE